MARDVLFAAPRSGTVKNQNAQKDEHGVLETTAQAIGATLGSLAVKTGLAKPPAVAAHAEPRAETRSHGNTTSMAGHKPGGKHARRSKKKK
jgi:hypothetical protein